MRDEDLGLRAAALFCSSRARLGRQAEPTAQPGHHLSPHMGVWALSAPSAKHRGCREGERGVVGGGRGGPEGAAGCGVQRVGGMQGMHGCCKSCCPPRPPPNRRYCVSGSDQVWLILSLHKAPSHNSWFIMVG